MGPKTNSHGPWVLKNRPNSYDSYPPYFVCTTLISLSSLRPTIYDGLQNLARRLARGIHVRREQFSHHSSYGHASSEAIDGSRTFLGPTRVGLHLCRTQIRGFGFGGHFGTGLCQLVFFPLWFDAQLSRTFLQGFF